VDSTAAAAVFPRYLSGTASPEDIKLYQDFMVHKIAELAGRHHLPVQIHTGLQTGNGNSIKNANPAHLATLFLAQRNTRFMLFHGGYPYMGEVATMVKNFPNVYVDMCWMTIIAPTSSQEWLYHWLETVPYNKILAYGGDTQTPWTSYGGSVMARDCVAAVLARKVDEGTMTMQDARIIAKRLLRDNAVEFYHLEPFL
jgi:predicted TIM-barrel fold metal-dependent hydrolase